MFYSAMKLLLWSFTFVAIFNHASGLSETSEVISLLESANGTSNTIASILPHMASSIRNQEEYQNRTAISLDRMEITLNQMASALSQVVRVLQDIDECSSAPCLNEGHCIDGVNKYTCQCLDGWSGNICEIDINACVSGPCQNGGQCADDVGNFSCHCVRGYTGRLCENNPTCQPDDFLCDDGSCIPDIYQCDGFADCNDGTDETEATCAVCPFRFLCTNGRCTDVRNVCDGTNDCEDNSDEDHICVACADYLGMENGDIPDGNIQALTYYESYYPHNARLNGDGGHHWLVSSSYSRPWIQADIGYQTYVSGVATQGSGGHWVASFKVSTFSMTTYNPETFVQDSKGSIKVFQGDSNYHSIVTSTFPEAVFARIVRITCLERGSVYWAMRFEILGCKED